MNETQHYKYPRLYVDATLNKNADIGLSEAQSHYLKNVLRKNIGDEIRVFNGKDGEWIASLTELKKKSAIVQANTQIKTQPSAGSNIHLLFAPIRKNRMDILIEKAVELGVSNLHPVLTTRTENRKLNADRTNAQIIEAAEQCERMDIPALHALTDLKKALSIWNTESPIYWAAERLDSVPALSEISAPQAFLVGPEGGFDDQEIEFLSAHPNIRPVNLGPRILRAETAALYCLSQIK